MVLFPIDWIYIFVPCRHIERDVDLDKQLNQQLEATCYVYIKFLTIVLKNIFNNENKENIPWP